MKVKQRVSQGIPKLIMQPNLRAAMKLLVDARLYAERSGSGPWEFAVEIHELLKRGLTVNELRLLTELKIVEHGVEVTTISDPRRRFQYSGNCSFMPRSCFLMTALGLSAFVKTSSGSSETAPTSTPSIRIARETHCCEVNTVRPEWNQERRLLTLDGVVVKHFRWPATNQEQILRTFHEEKWPVRILDPLAPAAEQVVKQRLSDTIKSLNRGQINALIHFRGDGSGEGIVWEAID